MTLSQHLSSRPDCRKLTYRCIIGIEEEGPRQLDISDILGRDITQYVTFIPAAYVYPDRFSKKDINRRSIVEHVIQMHFPEISDDYDILGTPLVQSNTLVPGIYEYQLSVSGKKRRWTRIL